jgi:hypothetical protein
MTQSAGHARAPETHRPYLVPLQFGPKLARCERPPLPHAIETHLPAKRLGSWPLATWIDDNPLAELMETSKKARRRPYTHGDEWSNQRVTFCRSATIGHPENRDA